ncbi:RNA polymerase sigma factor RpoD/SigA [Treponema peruense]|uniref:RNA polymerase sigma factor n=1 Tax=Treponema peruense TaxID=2787628 RepID=A0A7T3V4L2_9SPIR|nr:RNA polymerase sigma factor RpoD/SigA [Treponema peruense]QQA00523.1 RNA polymerase sigma factor RpoD/SigA [Treponema peruense]
MKDSFCKDLDVMKLHLNEINKIPLLSNEKEVELAKKAASGDKAARDLLVSSNMRFVVNVAKKYQNRGLDLEDLISEGYVGLLEAVTRFDVDRGYHFISYAVWWIRQSILKAVYEKGRAIRLPMNRTNEILQIEKARKAVSGSSKKTEAQELDEIASMLGMTKYHVREMLDISRDTLSLDAPSSYDDSGKMTLGDSVASDTRSDPSENAMDSSLRDSIFEVLGTLDSKSAQVLRMRFGLDSGECMSLKQVGDHFNLTKERIRQIEKTAIMRIRNSSRKDKLVDYVA